MNQTETFESMLARLEEITALLGEGNVPLERVISLYQEGFELSRKCGLILENAEMKIKKVVEDSEGNLSEQEFLGGE